MSIYEHKVKEYVTEKNLLKLLADEQSRDILIYLIEKPRSITEISKKFTIPKSTAYRRIHELEDLELVKVAGSIINERGRRSYVYISRISSVNLSLTSDGLILDIRPNKLKVELLSLSHI